MLLENANLKMYLNKMEVSQLNRLTPGQKILESNALELDVTDLPTGVYLLNLQNTQNQISTFKIIKK